MTPDEVVTAARTALGQWREERATRLDRIDGYARGRHRGPYRPHEAEREYEGLRAKAITPVLPLVLDVLSQTLFVEGFRASRTRDNAPPWGIWQANGMDGRQGALHHTALMYGVAYALILPNAPALPSIRGMSPRVMHAVYDDPAADEWARYAIHVSSGDTPHTHHVRLYDDNQTHELVTGVHSDGGVTYVGASEHGIGVCPVVRYTDGLDLEGRVRGRIESLMPLQDRLDQTVFDLLMTQTFASWKIRTVSGMAKPDTAAGAAAAKLVLEQSRLLVADDPDTRFGTLDETPLTGFLEAAELAVRHIATVAQVPPHNLLGQMSNLSAEALAAAESGLQRNVAGIRIVFGESHEQTLRLAAAIAGLDAYADDDAAQVRWRDTESRSLAQVADALGKLSTMLGVPSVELWDRIPGVTDQDVERWKAAAREEQAAGLADLAGVLDRQGRPALDA